MSAEVMPVEHLEILVEELSMEAALRILLPPVLAPLSFEIYPYQGKHDLLQKLPDRLTGYARWLPEEWHILVIVDRDDDDCHRLKQRLDTISMRAGLNARTRPAGQCFSVTNNGRNSSKTGLGSLVRPVP